MFYFSYKWFMFVLQRYNATLIPLISVNAIIMADRKNVRVKNNSQLLEFQVVSKRLGQTLELFLQKSRSDAL